MRMGANALTIVIPALNEEEAIGSTVTRCLDAREAIKEAAGLDDVEIIVVSDGSTDRTVEIASGFEEVKLIVFETNRGYGAAIKAGFELGKGDLVGFIDADGTCDPRYFADMCKAAVEDEFDIALGSRMGPNSKMPKIRRLGNRIYAFLLGLLCGRHVTDTASGMRVIRRSALKTLYPLPDRLHFTPSMSARALLNGLRVMEIPMNYEERVGTSKLSVLKDGVRFLMTIFSGVLCYRPERLFLMGFFVCLAFGIVLAMHPTEHYFRNGALEEWMIYRFVACFLLGASGFLLLCAGGLAHRIARLRERPRDGYSFWAAIAASIFQGKTLGAFVVLLLGGSLFALWPGIVEYVTTAHINLHWSRLLVGTLGLLLAFQSLITFFLMQVINIWEHQAQLTGAAVLERRSSEEALASATEVQEREPAVVAVGGGSR